MVVRMRRVVTIQRGKQRGLVVCAIFDLKSDNGRDPFDQNFRKFRSKTQWKNWFTFWGGPLFPVGPVWMLVEWIASNNTLSHKHLQVHQLR